MSDNINLLKATGSQIFLNYGARNPYDVSAKDLKNGLVLNMSSNEASSVGFNYPSFRLYDPQNNFDKAKIYQQGLEAEFKLDVEANCIVPGFFLALQYENKSTDITKNITHTSPMMNIESIDFQIGSNNKYKVKPEDIYVYNSVRLSHGDKMFPDLIDNLGISKDYDIDPVTNNIPPASYSRWYIFNISLFSLKNIPYYVLTNNTSQCLIKVSFNSNKFILPDSPNQNYSDLAIKECKLIVSQVFIHPENFSNMIKSSPLQYRINDTKDGQNNIALDTNTLINDPKYTYKVTSRSGGISLLLIGLRERNNPLAFASFIPLNEIAIKRIDGRQIKDRTFNTDILKFINSYEHQTGEFFLKKNLVAFTFDSMIDSMILTGYHGGAEVFEDEWYIEFEVLDKSDINPNKSYELVLLMYTPKLLNVYPQTKNIEIKK